MNYEIYIKRRLLSLGFSPRYRGYDQLVYAIVLCREQQVKVFSATKWLYPQVAEEFSTNWHAVERNMRTSINHAWENNPDKLVSGLKLRYRHKPRIKELVQILLAEDPDQI
jgi:two-component system response regulator (stage 0 sporulation protein A)